MLRGRERHPQRGYRSKSVRPTRRRYKVDTTEGDHEATRGREDAMQSHNEWPLIRSRGNTALCIDVNDNDI